jgi:hypothetical protein
MSGATDTSRVEAKDRRCATGLKDTKESGIRNEAAFVGAKEGTGEEGEPGAAAADEEEGDDAAGCGLTGKGFELCASTSSKAADVCAGEVRGAAALEGNVALITKSSRLPPASFLAFAAAAAAAATSAARFSSLTASISPRGGRSKLSSQAPVRSSPSSHVFALLPPGTNCGTGFCTAVE